MDQFVIPSKVLFAAAWGATEMIDMLGLDIQMYLEGHPSARTADEIVKKAADIIDILRFLEEHRYHPKLQWNQLSEIKELESFLPKKCLMEMKTWSGK